MVWRMLEVNAAVKLWERSESIGFRYTTLLCDEDSKSFLELKERNVYGSETQIKKEECINHVSKRLGTALRQTVKDWRVKGVTLGGKKRGSLKETIKKLTRYYTNAIRKNKGDIEAMETAIYATLFHCMSTDQKPQHKKCPSGIDSWCFYQSSLARGKKPGFHKDWVKTPINEEYLPKILPIYQRLASSELLSREWATEHVNWRRNEWSNVLFSEESRFSVHPDNRRIFIWRDRGSRNNPAFVHESVRFGSGEVLVYGGISIDGRTDLYIIRDGTLTARQYRNEILISIVDPYAAAIGDDFILMDDNCRPHRANLVEDFLFEEGVVRMEWPACSPDMNPIEHVWDALGRRVAGRQPPPQTL
ncbi:transposable element Tcb2 transposase [Trichonephila clavipes]|nr:transposable element Tcb2 transposase [Trichonephila clavipes]